MRTTYKFQSTRPRGARRSVFRPHQRQNRSFNPRARGGRDLTYEIICVTLILPFQSTRPRGARLFLHLIHNPVPVFQSTRPRGARHFIIVHTIVFLSVSIHAPAGGATRSKFNTYHKEGLFQSTRPRGARLQLSVYTIQSFRVSIHAPAGGATAMPKNMMVHIIMFQSTRPRGARLINLA